METVSIRSNTPFDLAAIRAALSRRFDIQNATDAQLVVHGFGTRIYIQESPEAGALGECELWLDYSDVEFVKQVLDTIVDRRDVTVDNDFGTILPGDQFAALCRANPAWNWRDAPPI